MRAHVVPQAAEQAAARRAAAAAVDAADLGGGAIAEGQPPARAQRRRSRLVLLEPTCGVVHVGNELRRLLCAFVLDSKAPLQLKTMALYRPALQYYVLAAMAHYLPAPITPLARF